MKIQDTLLLSRSDLKSLLRLGEYIEAVEQAFKFYAEGQVLQTGLLHIEAPNGEFHIKAGGLLNARNYFGAKINGGFFKNTALFEMPNIQGAILLCDGENGAPLAIMDSVEITRSRTAAATAVAAKYLARPDSAFVTICGCGAQARAQLRALHAVLPIKHAYAYSRSENNMNAFAEDMSTELRISVQPARNLHRVIKESDIVVTCTPAKLYFIREEYVSPGTFIAAVGADSPDKQELEPNLLTKSKVVVDMLEQCALVGELHHAIAAKLMSRENVHAELGEIVAKQKPGRTYDEEITIFDSTGTALQDVAAAAAIYERALATGEGTPFNFAA